MPIYLVDTYELLLASHFVKRVVSLIVFDMKGAYNGVCRTLLS